MDSLTKMKILVGVGCGILILCVFFLFSGSSDKDKDAEKQETDVSLRGKETTITIDEMMAANEDNAGKDNGITPDYNRFGGEQVTGGGDGSTQSEADIEALQAQLRANLTNSIHGADEGQVSTPRQAPAPVNYYAPQEVQPRRQNAAPQAETYDRLSAPASAKPAKTEQATTETPAPQKQPNSRFYNGKKDRENTGNSIAAVVHGEQTVSAGGTLKMRLLQNLTTETGAVIPKNTFIYGTVSFSGERMHVLVTSVRLGTTHQNVAEQVYDEDGQLGIYVPQSTKAEAKKAVEGEAISSADVNSETSGGIVGNVVSGVSNAVKSVIGRNTAKQKVTVKSNYRIYLIHSKKY